MSMPMHGLLCKISYAAPPMRELIECFTEYRGETGKRGKNERVKSIVTKIMEVMVTNGMTVTIGTRMTVGTFIRILKC